MSSRVMRLIALVFVNVYISWWYFLPYISYWSPRYIFSYINLSRGWYFHISTKWSKTGCFIFHHSLKAVVMTKQTNNCAGSSWRLKRFLRLACNRTRLPGQNSSEFCQGAIFEMAWFCVCVGCNDLGRRKDLKKLTDVYLCVLTMLDSMREKSWLTRREVTFAYRVTCR